MIEFEDVTFVHQNGVRALDGVSLRIEDGETVAIVGENGAGKTTLVKHVTGLLKPAEGKVLVDSKDTATTSTAQLSRKVGVAFQNPDHQLFSESVEQEMSFALRNFGFSAELVERRVTWGLELFGLEEYRKSSPLVLSGGEKKRLTLACILAWDPEVVILDEPTVGQDSIQKEKLVGTIRMLASSEDGSHRLSRHRIPLADAAQGGRDEGREGRGGRAGVAAHAGEGAARLGQGRTAPARGVL